jgi:hypothetical protein
MVVFTARMSGTQAYWLLCHGLTVSCCAASANVLRHNHMKKSIILDSDGICDCCDGRFAGVHLNCTPSLLFSRCLLCLCIHGANFVIHSAMNGLAVLSQSPPFTALPLQRLPLVYSGNRPSMSHASSRYLLVVTAFAFPAVQTPAPNSHSPAWRRLPTDFLLCSRGCRSVVSCLSIHDSTSL